MTISAIETSYAGCRFRSRLEARWAVFFDTLGVRWEYEPQGFMCTHRLTWQHNPDDDSGFGYLPDFWLPDSQVWAEVKGSLSDDETMRLLDAAAHLSSNGGGGCHDSGGHDLVVLGPVPRPGSQIVPAVLHMHKGDLRWSAFDFGKPAWCRADPTGDVLYTDAGDWGAIYHGGYVDNPAKCSEFLLRGVVVSKASDLDRGYTAARSARFEHGVRG